IYIENASRDDEVRQWARQAQQKGSLYTENFKKLQAAIGTRGLDHNSETQDELRNAARTVGKIGDRFEVNNIAMAFLRMRRHEKDYHRTGTAGYLEKHRQSLRDFSHHTTISSIDDTLKNRLKQELAGYNKVWKDYLKFAQSSSDTFIQPSVAQPARKPVTGIERKSLEWIEQQERYGKVDATAAKIDNLLERRFVQDSSTLYLTLRKHEKDYLLQPDSQYLQRLDQTLATYRQNVRSSSIPAKT
ncbi:MAG: hypothetical protein GY765_04205, partial [bacterium]|nr:hypothetical protein [bacterium]